MIKEKTSIAFFLLLALLVYSAIPLPQHIHKIPLTLSSNYAYFAELYLGNNKQNVKLLVDTGSRTMAAYCSLCFKGCKVE